MRYQGFDPATMAGYLWPPRPGKGRDVAVTGLPALERLGTWGQVKKNGTNNTLYVRPDRIVLAMNRHHETHKQWQPTKETHAAFAHLPGSGWYVLCAELLHSKVADPRLKNINYLHDMLVADGEYLVGATFADRQDLLAKLFPDAVPALHGSGYKVIDAHTWLAVNHKPNPHKPGFAALFRSLTAPEDEGLVLKRPTAKLVLCHTESANDRWQWKCRRPHANYHH